MRSILLACLLPAVAHAADADWSKDPPRLAVRLTFDASPRLDEAFRREFARELDLALSASFGPNVAQVGDDATHTFSARVSAGRDDLRADAVSTDLLTKFASPTREARGGRLDELVRILTYWAARDFGVNGRFEPTGDRVRLRLQGGGALAKKGNVFAAYALMAKAGDKPATAKRLDEVLLLADGDAKDGVLDCKVFRRYAEGWPKRGVTGLVAVRLGTGRSPLRFKLVDEAGRAYPPNRFRVQAGGEEFPDGPKAGVELTRDADGFLTSPPLPGVALLRISEGERTVGRFPIALLDDSAVVRSLKSDPTAEDRTRLERARRALAQAINDSLLAQAAGVERMIALNAEGKAEAALEYAQALEHRMREEAKAHAVELQALSRDAAEKLAKGGEGFADALNPPIAELARRAAAMSDQTRQLRDAVDRRNDPAVMAKQREAQQLITQAELHVTQLDYDAALRSYDAALAKMDEGKAKTELAASVAKLRESWRVKDASHDEARQFFLTKFNKLTPSQIEPAMPDAEKHLAKLQAVGDRLTVTRLLFDGLKLASAIEAEAGNADPNKPDDRPRVEKLEKTLASLTKFLNEARAWSEKAKK